LLSVAAYAQIDYNADWFVEDLMRLAMIDVSAAAVALGKLLEVYVPTFDFQDSLRSLLEFFADHDHKVDAIILAQKLHQLPGMLELYKSLAAQSRD
jgi:hypothetical protein